MSLTSCDDRMSAASTSQVFRILPRSGITAWNSRSRACFAEPPAESPSTRNSSQRSGSCKVQSASLPGSAGPLTIRLRVTRCAARVRSSAFAIANCAIFSPASGCWFSHSANASLTTPETKAADSRDESFSLIWPANCGFCIRTESTNAACSQTSSGASFMPRGTRLRNSQNSRTASVTPARSPFTCVPPCGVGIRLT